MVPSVTVTTGDIDDGSYARPNAPRVELLARARHRGGCHLHDREPRVAVLRPAQRQRDEHCAQRSHWRDPCLNWYAATGVPDLAVGAPGSVYLYTGSTTGYGSSPSATLSPPSSVDMV